MADILVGGTAWGRGLVYGGALLICAMSGAAALFQLVGGAATPSATLPLGLPWLGAHFRMDALSAFFLVVVNLGAVAASLFALGHGRHEHAPMRVLPFYPAFLAEAYLSAEAAFSTSSAWPSTFTLRQMLRMTPLPSMRKVERSMPIYFLPYMLFSTQVP
jgi:hydrogenase-4 component B